MCRLGREPSASNVWCLVQVQAQACRVDTWRLATRHRVSTRSMHSFKPRASESANVRYRADGISRGRLVKKMIYHSSSPGLRQTQVHRSRQSHIRIRAAAGVRARTRVWSGAGEQRREGVVVRKAGRSMAVASRHMHGRGRSSRGPGMGLNLDDGGEGGARMAGFLISSGSLEGSETILGGRGRCFVYSSSLNRPVFVCLVYLPG